MARAVRDGGLRIAWAHPMRVCESPRCRANFRPSKPSTIAPSHPESPLVVARLARGMARASNRAPVPAACVATGLTATMLN